MASTIPKNRWVLYEWTYSKIPAGRGRFGGGGGAGYSGMEGRVYGFGIDGGRGGQVVTTDKNRGGSLPLFPIWREQ